jgi:hypothetical protein
VRLELGPAPASSPQAGDPTLDVAAGPRQSSFAWFAGAGLGLAVPLGRIAIGTELEMNDYVGPGVGLELHFGLRFARYFGAQVFAEVSRHVPADGAPVDFGEVAAGASGRERVEVETSVTAQSFGASLLVGSAPGTLGGFGELGFAWQRLLIDRELGLAVGTRCGNDTSQRWGLSGASLRVGGGAQVPLSRMFQVSPFARATLGRFTQADWESCDALPAPFEGEIGAGRRATHAMLLIGVSGQLLFGRR